jgi:hypothetical protein
MEKVAIQYVGKKPVFRDHIFGTRLSWERGGVRFVDASISRQILKHPEFMVSRNTDVPLSLDDLALNTDVRDESAGIVETEDFPLANLDAMPREQLRQYAKRQFNIDLPERGRLSSTPTWIETIRQCAMADHGA